MQHPKKTLLHHSMLLVFVSVTHLAAGVQIDSVGLESGLPYVDRLSPAHIKFNLTMQPDEELESVVWQRNDGKGSYEWRANGITNVSGIFLEAINTSAANGELLFTSAQQEHSGHYTLTVFTSDGKETATYNLIVYYYSHSYIKDSRLLEKNCTWSIGLLVPEVAPYPNISCVFEDGIGAGPPRVPLDEIAEMKIKVTDHRNGTFKYDMASNISIQKIPMESTLSCQFWIEDSRIPLFTLKASVTNRPCPEPEDKQYFTYNILIADKSCYGGYGPSSLVTYYCTYGPYDQNDKTMQCINGRWVESNPTPRPNCNAPPATTTKKPCSGNCNSGTPITFHLKLFSAIFLIASYYTAK